MTQQQLVEVANHRARTASSCSVNNSFQTCLLQLSNVSLAASWLACRKPDECVNFVIGHDALKLKYAESHANAQTICDSQRYHTVSFVLPVMSPCYTKQKALPGHQL